MKAPPLPEPLKKAAAATVLAAHLAGCAAPAPVTTTRSTTTQVPGHTTVTADAPGADTSRPYSPGTTTTTTSPTTVTTTTVEEHAE